jgi:hypothetical protein
LEAAVIALEQVASELRDRSCGLSDVEWRTYLWARASLAVLIGIRADTAWAISQPAVGHGWETGVIVTDALLEVE